MKTLYARFVLWLIGPALDVRKRAEERVAVEKGAELELAEMRKAESNGGLRRKMLDDLSAQRASITRKIGELEAQGGC